MAVTVNTREVDKLFRDLRKIFPIEVRAGNRAMLITEERIKDRTLSGVDVNNIPFAPYSEAYGLFREETGRQITPVDLFFSGEMFAAMTHRVTKESMEIFFGTIEDEDKAEKHLSGIGVPERAFFDVNDSDLQAILDELITPFDVL